MFYEGAWINTTGTGNGVAVGEIAILNKEYADGAHDEIGGHNDGETNKGLDEGFFAGGDFAGVTARKTVQVAAVDDVA